MRQVTKKRTWCALVLCILLYGGSTAALAQADAQGAWTDIAEVALRGSPVSAIAEKRTLTLDLTAMQAHLVNVPMENVPGVIPDQARVSLPMPDGSTCVPASSKLVEPVFHTNSHTWRFWRTTHSDSLSGFQAAPLRSTSASAMAIEVSAPPGQGVVLAGAGCTRAAPANKRVAVAIERRSGLGCTRAPRYAAS